MKNNLDIFLITYNRKTFLEETLKRLCEADSPLSGYSITILDNNSNDGTRELCEDFVRRFANLCYVKNNRNLGLAGNICKAMELASKKYYWIICDNDKIDYASWPDIEKAMDENYDLIMASVDYNCDMVQDKRSFVLAQSTFLPGCIYKTQFLTDDVMAYALADVHTVLPHVCMACNIINNDGRIFIPKTSVISLTFNVKIEDITKYSYDRTVSDNKNKLVHERTRSCNFPAGVCGSFKALKDDRLRRHVIQNFIYPSRLNGYGPFLNIAYLYKIQYGFTPFHPMSPHIWNEFTRAIPASEKVKALLFMFIPVAFYYQGDWFYIRIGQKFKTKLLKNVKGKYFFDFLTNFTY